MVLGLIVYGGAYANSIETIAHINTQGGIKSETRCSYVKFLDVSGTTKDKIICDDGSSFDAPVVKEVSSTGTPGWVTYTNFIGEYSLSNGVLLGSGKKKILFDGPPRLK